MKKYLIIGLSIISSLFFVSNVKAETYTFNAFDYGIYSTRSNGQKNLKVGSYKAAKELGINENIETILELLYQEYTTNYITDYPYYYMDVVVDLGVIGANEEFDLDSSLQSYNVDVNMYVFKENSCSPMTKFYTGTNDDGYFMSIVPNASSTCKYNREYVILYSYYRKSSNVYTKPSVIQSGGASNLLFYYSNYYSLSYFISNFEVYNTTENIIKVTGNREFTINPGDLITPMYSSYEDFISGGDEEKLTEVDLNSYPYIILSLKDYSKTEEFSAINYVKGQYCLTSVYNYGSTEKKDIIEGSKNKRCSLYYDNYTPIRTYILNSDLKNNAIYYLKAYDTTKENKVKIDTSIFNIHYISEEEKDNPIITINGKKYTPKSYDDLTDTATKSEDENYADGASEEFSITDIFSAPLEFFKKIINAISEFNGLIKELFSFLPDEFLVFLLAAFALLVVVAIVKILL